VYLKWLFSILFYFLFFFWGWGTRDVLSTWGTVFRVRGRSIRKPLAEPIRRQRCRLRESHRARVYWYFPSWHSFVTLSRELNTSARYCYTSEYNELLYTIRKVKSRLAHLVGAQRSVVGVDQSQIGNRTFTRMSASECVCAKPVFNTPCIRLSRRHGGHVLYVTPFVW